MQRKRELTPEELHKKQADVIAYLAAQKPPVIGEHPFDALPPDITCYIANQYLPLSDARRFANTCRKFLIFTDKLKPVIRRANAEVHQFLTYVLNSDLVRASEMLLLDPGLVLEAQSIGEHQQVNGLQLARNLGDAGMCQMMLECAAGKLEVEVKLPVKTNQKKLFNEKYFDWIAAAIASAAKKDKQSIASEIGRHRMVNYNLTTLGKYMDAFRSLCDQHGEMSPQDVINAFLALAKHWDKLKTYNEVNLFFLQVIGYVERLCPVWFRQALVEGIKNLLQPNPVLQRITECDINNVNHPVVTLLPSSGFGFDFACDQYSGRDSCIRLRYRTVFSVRCLAVCLKHFVGRQNQNLMNLADAGSRALLNPRQKN